MVLVKFAFEKLRLSKAAAMFTVSSVMRYMLATIQAKSLKLRLKASVCYQSLSLSLLQMQQNICIVNLTEREYYSFQLY